MHHKHITRAAVLGLLASALALLPTTSPASAEDPEVTETAVQVADTNPQGGAFPTYLTALGNQVYFSAFTTQGRELWRSDGTAAGTTMVVDIGPGTESGSPELITRAGDRLFFWANDRVHGFELWTSDGTAEGTRMVEDINPGSLGGNGGEIVALGDVVIFGAKDGTHGREIWRSDGTPEGTWMVADIFEGAQDSSPQEMTLLGGKVHFRADDGLNGTELWTTDGTSAGTAMVADTAPGNRHGLPSDLTPVGMNLFFVAGAGGGADDDGRELWLHDTETGTTHQVADINPGTTEVGYPADSAPSLLVDVGGTLFFTADDGTHGRELWTSDGSTTGTAMVRDIEPGPEGGAEFEGDADAVAFGDNLLFDAEDGMHGAEPWISDGTAAGTRMVHDIHPSHDSHVTEPVVWLGAAYFSARDGFVGAELWRSDGTTTGTTLVQDLYPGRDFQDFPYDGDPTRYVEVGDTLYFTADSAAGRELWKLTRTAAPTDAVAPETTLTDGPEGTVRSSSASFGFVADESPSAFECRLDDAAWAACTSPHLVENLAQGPHTFAVRALDTAGNVDTSPATRDFAVDTVAPETTITSGPHDTISVTAVQFAFAADDAAASFECRLDGAAWTACASPHDLTDLADGQHTFDVRGLDPAGNVDSSPATRTFTVATEEEPPVDPTDPTDPTGPSEPSAECVAARAELQDVKERLRNVGDRLEKARKKLRNAKQGDADRRDVRKAKRRVKALKKKVDRLKDRRVTLREAVAESCD